MSDITFIAFVAAFIDDNESSFKFPILLINPAIPSPSVGNPSAKVLRSLSPINAARAPPVLGISLDTSANGLIISAAASADFLII